MFVDNCSLSSESDFSTVSIKRVRKESGFPITEDVEMALSSGIPMPDFAKLPPKLVLPPGVPMPSCSKPPPEIKKSSKAVETPESNTQKFGAFHRKDTKTEAYRPVSKSCGFAVPPIKTGGFEVPMHMSAPKE